MSIKGLVNNLKKEGVAGTIRIRNERREKAAKKREENERARIRKYEAAKLTKEALEETGADAGTISKIDSIIEEIASTEVTNENAGKLLRKWDKDIISTQTRDCMIAMRRWFIKERIPKAYDEEKGKPVEDKIVFMQPGRNLNQSFRLLFEKIEKEYPFTPVLCELRRDVASYAEHYLNAIDFIREAATAKAIMVHNSSPFLGYVDIRPETKVIQLWHGCGVIKHLGLTAAGTPGARTPEYYEEFPEYNKYDLVTICSKEQRWVFEDFMGKEKGDPVIQPWGMARTDEFFDPEYVENCYRKLHKVIPASRDKKVILYAPTYRGRAGGRHAPDVLDIAKFAEKLSDDYVLIVKYHQSAHGNLPPIPEEYKDKFAYDMSRSNVMDINELMTVSDIMISDYSSVIFEYSLFERPIIFFMYDLEDYRDNRGMYYSYEELAKCGPIFKDNESIVDYIEHVDERFDKSKVTEFRDYFMSACDGHASERVMDFIMDKPVVTP